MRAIYVLWLRHLKRYVRTRSRIIGALCQPLLFLASLGFGLGPLFAKAGQGNYLQFLTPGVVGMTVLFTSIMSGGDVIWDRQFGFLKAVLVAPVPRSAIMIGRMLAGATTATLQGLIVIAVCCIGGFRPASMKSFVLGVVFMVLVAILFTGLGTAIASLVSDFQGFNLVMNFLVMPMFLLSGALYPLRHAPQWLRAVAVVDPFAYGVDGMRGALLGIKPQFGIGLDLMIVLGACILLTWTGSYFISKIQV